MTLAGQNKKKGKYGKNANQMMIAIRFFGILLYFPLMRMRRRKLGLQMRLVKSRIEKDVPNVDTDQESDIGVGHVMVRYAQRIVGMPKGSYASFA